MRAAFKEWAIVVDALGRGEQIVILRKGGIAEGRGGFQVQQPKFWLFPTLFHQQRQSVVSSAQQRYDQIKVYLPNERTVRLEFWADVVAWRQLKSLATVEHLRGQHIWRDQVVAERFEWGRDKEIFALAVRVRRLPSAVEFPMSAAYGGCKSWIELERDVPEGSGVPVLSEEAFAKKLKAFHAALPDGS